MRVAALMIFLAACSSPLPVTRPLVVTAGVHRIATITVVDDTQANDLRAAAEAVRDARGNLGVFLLIAPVGAALGVLRFGFKRLGTGMFTHAGYNAVIMAVALLR